MVTDAHRALVQNASLAACKAREMRIWDDAYDDPLMECKTRRETENLDYKTTREMSVWPWFDQN